LEPQVQRLFCDLPVAAVQRFGRVLAGAEQRLGAGRTGAHAPGQPTAGQERWKHDFQGGTRRLRQASPLFLQSGRVSKIITIIIYNAVENFNTREIIIN